MSRRPRLSAPQPDLFSWQPPKVVSAYAPEKVRAASLAASLSKAVSASLKECGKGRDQVAREMGAYLGEHISPDVLDKYASEAAENHIINVVRFIGLLAATKDRRLLELIASQFDWAVIERKYLPAIDYATLLEQRAEIDRAADRMRSTLRNSGVL